MPLNSKITALLCGLFPLLLGAQQARVWSLKECVDQALSKNITIQQQGLTLKNASADAFQSRMSMLPNLNASATNNWQTGFGIDPSTNIAKEGVKFRTNSFGLSSSMPLFNGFQTLNTVRLQETNKKAVTQDLEQTKNTIVLNVCNAFLRVLQAVELSRSAQDRLQATRALVSRQEKLFELGGVNKSKLLQLKAQQATEELQAVTASNNVSQAYLDLWLLIDERPDLNARIELPESSGIKVEDEIRPLEAIYDEFSERSPDVKAAELRSQGAHLTYLVAQGQRSPRLMLTGSLSSFYTTQSQQGVGSLQLQKSVIGAWDNGTTPVPVYSYMPTGYSAYQVTPFDNQFSRNFGTNIGLSLSVPVFNAWGVNTNVSKTRANEMSSRLQAKQTRNTLYKTIAQSYTDFKASYKKYDANKVNYDANKEAFEMAEKQFELGGMSMSDYLNSKNAYIRAESDHTQARYELLFRRKVLDYYLGKPLY